jgi:hypothetical protein
MVFWSVVSTITLGLWEYGFRFGIRGVWERPTLVTQYPHLFSPLSEPSLFAEQVYEFYLLWSC